MFFAKQSTPRWVIMSIDIIITICSVILAYLLRFNFNIPQHELSELPFVTGYVVIIRVITFLIAKTYAGIIRYTSTGDALRVFFIISLGSLFFALTNIITYYFILGYFFIPFSIIIIDYIATTFAMTAFRLLVKIAYMELTNISREKRNVLIIGAGESGIIAKQSLDRDTETKHNIVGFLDDNIKKVNKKLEGVNIYHTDKLAYLLSTNSISHVILSIQNLSPARKRDFIETCLLHNTKIMNVPPVIKWINGELSFKQIKDIQIEDLLEREIINLDEKKISNEIAGKKVLITGASGSIGSELVRQISRFSPKKIILTDQAETPLHHIELECLERSLHNMIQIVIADVRNKRRMNTIFEICKPDIVYHAAAYKHVPMMENNPSESILTNVKGTKILADLCIEHNVVKFIQISTDKAVNPTNIMGASKRIAEIYIQSLNQKGKTKFVTTRFGNVIGSNGSAIPLFRNQIKRGGPITITHPKVTRYFMTIPEACQLVLEAGAIGKGGEIFIFDMGKSIKIVDIAKKMIKLSGLTLGRDIQIIYTGLRPGEKLYEELLNDEENTLPTHHPQIMIAKVKSYDHNEIALQIDDLVELFDAQDNFSIVKKMKEILPEFKSKNSIYEQLDG
ncbi:MAG: polysaccharide biosynthesis protein [Bacteroidales bacterium]|nr:polysaccharide biosynthesis protein [Bacteroidales bacterium]